MSTRFVIFLLAQLLAVHAVTMFDGTVCKWEFQGRPLEDWVASGLKCQDTNIVLTPAMSFNEGEQRIECWKAWQTGDLTGSIPSAISVRFEESTEMELLYYARHSIRIQDNLRLLTFCSDFTDHQAYQAGTVCSPDDLNMRDLRDFRVEVGYVSDDLVNVKRYRCVPRE